MNFYLYGREPTKPADWERLRRETNRERAWLAARKESAYHRRATFVWRIDFVKANSDSLDMSAALVTRFENGKEIKK